MSSAAVVIGALRVNMATNQKLWGGGGGGGLARDYWKGYKLLISAIFVASETTRSKLFRVLVSVA